MRFIHFLISFVLVFACIHSPLLAQAKGGGSSKDGFKIKGGLWGIGGSFKSELQDKHFLDNALRDGIIDLDWNEKKNFYLLNPLGLEYSMKAGSGSLVFGLDFYGFFFLQNIMGFNPKYDFNSISNGSFGMTDNDLKYRNMDLSIGYRLTYQQFSFTPKYFLRNFNHKYKEDSMYFGLGGRSIGIGNYSQDASTWTGFLGLDFLFDITKESAIFFDFAIGSPILGQWYSSGMFNETFFGVAGNSGFASIHSGKLAQEITGSRIQLGYQHSFGNNLSLRVGYHTEKVDTKYSKYGGIPIVIGGNGADIDVLELILDKAFVYSGVDSTELKSLYISLQYAF
jgi:hypothetical protein